MSSGINFPNDPGLLPPAGIVGAPSPTGIPAIDENNLQQALLALPANGILIPRPGTYAIRPSAGGTLLYPNNCSIWIPAGTVIRVPDNTTTGNQSYNLFVAASDPAVNVHFIIDGTLDGNTANNPNTTASSEFTFGLNLSDAQGCSVTGAGLITNWRGDGIYSGGGSFPTRRVFVGGGGLRFVNCGVPKLGDGGNPRQGVAFAVGASDVLVDGAIFDTIGGYAIDFEGPGHTYDNCVAGPSNVYRNCGVKYDGTAQGAGGYVNFVGTILPTCRAYPGVIAGTYSTGVLGVAPAGMARKVRAALDSGNLSLNTATINTFFDVGLPDLTLPAMPGDIIEYKPSVGLQAPTVNAFISFDVGIVPAGAAANTAPSGYFSSGGAVADGAGVPAWRYNHTALNDRLAGPAWYVVQAADVVNGQVTLRMRYSTGTASPAMTVFAAHGGSGAQRATVAAENLGPGW